MNNAEIKIFVKNFLFTRLGNEPKIKELTPENLDKWLDKNAEILISSARAGKATDEMIEDFFKKNPKVILKDNWEIEII